MNPTPPKREHKSDEGAIIPKSALSAEQMAEDILGEICQYIPDSPEQERYFKSIRKCLERALTAYADAKLEEVILIKQAVAYSNGWDEALEDAAQVSDLWKNSHSCGSHDNNPCCHIRTGAAIGEHIRLLKSPGGSK